MTTRRKIGLVAAICGAVFFGSRSCSVKASALDTVTLTPAQTRALLGDSLTMTYFDGSDYQTAQLTYATNTATKNPENDFGYANSDRNLFNTICPDGTRYLVYYATIPDIVPTVAYPTVQITPTVEFSGVSLASFILGFSAADAPESSGYNFVSYYVNGNEVINHVFRFHGSATTQANQYDAKLAFTISNTTRYFLCAPVYYRSDTEKGYISDITYKQAGTIGTDVANGFRTIRFIISCPTLSEVGSIGSTTGGGTIGGDLEATNRKLDVIIQLLNTIADNTDDDSDESVPDSSDYETPIISIPDWFETAMTQHKAAFDVTVDGSPIFGLVPTEDTEVGDPTAGGQLFAPNTEEGISLVPADPSSGGILQSMRFFWALLADLVETMPVISKLITLFIGASIASWLIFGGRGS